MSIDSNHILSELERIHRVADIMVTAHAKMKECYSFKSAVSDVGLFTCSLILCTVAFADQRLLVKYFGNDILFIIGFFSLVVFIYSFVASVLNWSVKTERHKFAFEQYSNIKLESKVIIAKIKQGEASDPYLFLEKYKWLTPTIIAIPEKLFLKYKRHHALKVYISKYLDDHPGTWPWLLRLRLWWKDNHQNIKDDRE